MSSALCLRDLDFDQVPLSFRTSEGRPYTRWQRVGMPRISQRFLNSTFFLYASREDAEAGRRPGGTGFIVKTGQQVMLGGGDYFYGVTNWHVAVRDGFSVVRLNKKHGGCEILEFGPEEWAFKPGGVDVAIIPLDLDHDYIYSSISVGSFAPEEQYRSSWPGHNTDQLISVGEDAFMIGLFVDHHGKTTNIPGARFGNVSMLANPVAPIKQPTGHSGESHVIDMHSRTGFSGSPVFVYRTFGSDLTKSAVDVHGILAGSPAQLVIPPMFYFFGIHWGQFPETWELKNSEKLSESRRNHLITDGASIEGWSGMTCVIPAHKIVEVLGMSELQKKRDANPFNPSRSEPKAESRTSETADANPNHKEDFTALLDAAARKPK